MVILEATERQRTVEVELKVKFNILLKILKRIWKPKFSFSFIDNKKVLKKYIKQFLLFLIRMIERIEYRGRNFDGNDISKKIIESQTLEDLEVLTDSGWESINYIHKTQPYRIWRIETENGKYLECADNHIVFDNLFNKVFIKDLNINDFIQTDEGLTKVTKKQIKNYSISMFDVTVNSSNHRYYTNGILSHNTVISSIFLVWYLLFNFDRNVLLIANKGDTVKEIMEKVRSIMENLPFFLKPGILKKDVMNMKFDNGCRILGKATTKTSSIGFTIHLLYSDEFAHIPTNILNHLWKSMYPTLSSSKVSKVIITSTPNGFNLFHNIYQNAVDGVNTFKAIFVPWWFVKGRDEEWKKKEIANLGSEEAFNQEYGCQFLSANDLLLDSDHLQFLKDNKQDYIIDNNLNENFPILGKEHKLTWKKVDGVENLFDYYIEKNPYILISVDTSEGVGGDNSVATFWQLKLMDIENAKKFARTNKVTSILNFITLEQIGKFSDNMTPPDKFAKILYWLVIKEMDIETVKLTVEANTFGGEIIRTLYNLYDDFNEFEDGIIIKFPHRFGSSKRYDGNKLNSENKRIYCNTTKRLIGEKKIIPTNPETIQEATFFSRNKKGSYEASTGHDDEFITVVHVGAVFKNIDFIEWAEEWAGEIENVDEYENLIDDFYQDDIADLFDDFDKAYNSNIGLLNNIEADDLDWI